MHKIQREIRLFNNLLFFSTKIIFSLIICSTPGSIKEKKEIIKRNLSHSVLRFIIYYFHLSNFYMYDLLLLFFGSVHSENIKEEFCSHFSNFCATTRSNIEQFVNYNLFYSIQFFAEQWFLWRNGWEVTLSWNILEF